MRWLILAALLVLFLGCEKHSKPPKPIGNLRPEILAVTVTPSRVLASQEVFVDCRARDRDGDRLAYWWTSTGGTFPAGSVRSSVRWWSPTGEAPQTLTAWVTDIADTVTAEIAIQISRVAPPDTLNFINGSNIVDLSWPASPDRNVEHWTGYEIYRGPRSLIFAPEDSLQRYRLTAVPITRQQYRVARVTPGERVFFHVRSRRDYMGITERSLQGAEIETAARLDGLGGSSLYEISSRRGAMGLHLPGGVITPLDPERPEGIDLFLGTDGPLDQGGALVLKSPDLLSYRDPAWTSQVTGIAQLGTDWAVAIPPELPYGREAAVETDRVYALFTNDGHYAKFRVLELAGTAPERRIVFQWAWQPAPGYPRF